jgi:hypothetical protein
MLDSYLKDVSNGIMCVVYILYFVDQNNGQNFLEACNWPKTQYKGSIEA